MRPFRNVPQIMTKRNRHQLVQQREQQPLHCMLSVKKSLKSSVRTVSYMVDRWINLKFFFVIIKQPIELTQSFKCVEQSQDILLVIVLRYVEDVWLGY